MIEFKYVQFAISILTLIGIGVMIGTYKQKLDRIIETIKRIFDRIEKIENNQRELHERLLKIEIEKELTQKQKNQTKRSRKNV